MTVFCTASKGYGEAAVKYEEAIRSLGHTVVWNDTDALLKADALFLCLCGENHTQAKADLNLTLDRGVPVAYVTEEVAVLDRGLKMQLGLARRIPPDSYAAYLKAWLDGIKAPKKKRWVLPACVVFLVLGVILALVVARPLLTPIIQPLPEVSVETEAPIPGAEYFDGQPPEAITSLDLSGRGLSDIGFLAQCSNLEVLNLSDNQITDLSPLATLTKLKRLDLSDNQITDVNVLLALKELETVDLRGNNLQDDAALAFLAGVEIVS